MTFRRWLTYLLGSLTCESHSPTSIGSTMALPPLGNPDHVFVSVSTDFPTTSTRDVPWYVSTRISLSPVLLLLLVNFVSWFR